MRWTAGSGRLDWTSELDIPEEVVLTEPMRLSGYACQAMAVQPHDGTQAEDIFLSFCDRYVAFIAQNNDSCAAKLQGQAAVFLNKHSSWNVLSPFFHAENTPDRRHTVNFLSNTSLFMEQTGFAWPDGQMNR